jgi:hypothetical protein
VRTKKAASLPPEKLAHVLTQEEIFFQPPYYGKALYLLVTINLLSTGVFQLGQKLERSWASVWSGLKRQPVSSERHHASNKNRSLDTILLRKLNQKSMIDLRELSLISNKKHLL